jgi:putative FmdB family regulatory protein
MIYWGGVYRIRIMIMPLYEYTCHDCGEDFDKIVRFSEADLIPECPSCGEENTTKKLSAGAVIGISSSGGKTAVSRPPSSPFT